MSTRLRTLTSRAAPGRYLVLTLSGTVYRLALAPDDAAQMLRTPEPDGGNEVAQSAPLYRDAQTLPIEEFALQVGQPGWILLRKPELLGTADTDGIDYAYTTRVTTPVVSIRRVDSEGDL